MPQGGYLYILDHLFVYSKSRIKLAEKPRLNIVLNIQLFLVPGFAETCGWPKTLSILLDYMYIWMSVRICIISNTPFCPHLPTRIHVEYQSSGDNDAKSLLNRRCMHMDQNVSSSQMFELLHTNTEYLVDLSCVKAYEQSAYPEAMAVLIISYRYQITLRGIFCLQSRSFMQRLFKHMFVED